MVEYHQLNVFILLLKHVYRHCNWSKWRDFFETSLAGSECEWEFTQSIPNTTGFPYRNSINGAYHDMDPSVGGSIWFDFEGVAPCQIRSSWDNVPQYNSGSNPENCNSIFSSSQVVLYESTNIIEVYIQDKPTCNHWNDGNALIGIQNAGGTIAYVPPGRNTGPWSTNNEAWRFYPNSNQIYSVEWFDNVGTSVGTGTTLNVCPTAVLHIQLL